MELKIIFSIIISLIIIIILHNLFIFFKNNLTAPKIKDFVEKPSKDYEDIYKIINNNENIDNNSTTNLENLPIKKVKFQESNYNDDVNLIKNKDVNIDMKMELKNFLNSLDS
jgi:nitrate reductase beta subunit